MRTAVMADRAMAVGMLLAAAAAVAEGRTGEANTVNTALTRKVDISTQFARVRSYVRTLRLPPAVMAGCVLWLGQRIGCRDVVCSKSGDSVR